MPVLMVDVRTPTGMRWGEHLEDMQLGVRSASASGFDQYVSLRARHKAHHWTQRQPNAWNTFIMVIMEVSHYFPRSYLGQQLTGTAFYVHPPQFHAVVSRDASVEPEMNILDLGKLLPRRYY
jgi:hypothetical protein